MTAKKTLVKKVENKSNKLVCGRCTHVWLSRIGRPKCCPRCRSYKWQEVPEYTD